MCLPVEAALSSSEVSGGAFKLYACYCAHRGEGFEVSIKSEQIHAETGLGYAYISTLKFELLEAGWIGLSKTTAKGIVPLKGFEGAAEHIRTERKLSKIETSSDKKASNIERKSGEVSKIESSVEPPEKLSKTERILSDEVSKIRSNSTPSFENQKEIDGTPVAPSKDLRTSTDTSQVSPSAQLGAVPKAKVVQHPSAKPETDHQRLMRELASRLRGIPDGGKQGKWAKWLLDNGYTIAECVECLDEMLAELKDPVHWREGKVDWAVVATNIAAWKLKREGMEAHGKSDAGTQNGAGGHPPQTGERPVSRRERNAAELRRQAATPMFVGTPTRQTG